MRQGLKLGLVLFIITINDLELAIPNHLTGNMRMMFHWNNSMKLDEIVIPRLCIENAPFELVTSFKVLRVTLNNKLQ